jgi:hypothetical protein
VPTVHISREAEASEEITDNSSESDNQEDEPADLREPEAFIVTSKAFEMLRQNLKSFVYPETLLESIPNQDTNDTTLDCSSPKLPMMCEAYEKEINHISHFRRLKW